MEKAKEVLCDVKAELISRIYEKKPFPDGSYYLDVNKSALDALLLIEAAELRMEGYEVYPITADDVRRKNAEIEKKEEAKSESV